VPLHSAEAPLAASTRDIDFADDPFADPFTRFTPHDLTDKFVAGNTSKTRVAFQYLAVGSADAARITRIKASPRAGRGVGISRRLSWPSKQRAFIGGNSAKVDETP